MKKTPSVVVPLAPGFEEIEAMTIIDVLRRAGHDAFIAGTVAGPIQGAHGVTVTPDGHIEDVDQSALKMVVLPGGLPGATNLRDCPAVIELLRKVHAAGGIAAAMCAAPMALGKAGLAAGRKVTCYPGFEEHLTGGTCVTDRVVADDRVITSRGPGTALEFALALVAHLGAPDTAKALHEGMLVK